MSTFDISGNASGHKEQGIEQATIEDLLEHILNQLRLQNKYLSILVGEELTPQDVEEHE